MKIALTVALYLLFSHSVALADSAPLSPQLPPTKTPE